MDFSQYIKQIQSQAIFSNYQMTVLQTQPTYNSTSCCSSLNTAISVYPDYAFRDLVAQGRVYCVSTCTVYALGTSQGAY